MHKTFVIFFFLISICSLFPQDKQLIINDLYSLDEIVVWQSLEEIEANNISEAIPTIIDLIPIKYPTTQLRFLEVLQFFNYEGLIDLVYEFIGRADSFNNVDPPFDPLSAKIRATLLLFYLGDFSTYEYVFQDISRSKPAVATEAIYLLPLIYEYVPTSSNDAYKELLYGYLNSSDGSDVKYFCLENLNKLNPSNFNADLINQFTQSEIFENRIQALRLLCRNRIQGLNQILINQLSNEDEASIRIKIADSLLALYGFPSDLKAVIDHLPNETNSTAHSIMSFEIREFIPPRPIISTVQMIENLILYTTQLFQYNWINDSTNYKTYVSELEKQKKFYIEKDEEKLNHSIKHFLEMVEEHHKPELLTEEGYKYLHYYGTYIEGNVKEEF